jgi:hypothetical protein
VEEVDSGKSQGSVGWAQQPFSAGAHHWA